MKVIQIDGIIGWDVTGRGVRRQLEEAGGAPVRVEINSPGGFVFDGLEIFNRLKNYKGEVHTHIMSIAASMASVISLAGSKRTAEPTAVYMIHNVWGIEVGDHRAMRAEADILEGLTGLLSNTYAEITRKPLAEIRQMMDDETFLFGDEIKAAGFVDEMSGVSDDAGSSSRASAVATTKLAFQDCMAKLKERGQSKEELDKVAALLTNVQNALPSSEGSDKQDGDLPDNSKTANTGGQFKQEAVMDLEKLQSEHPALYAQVMQAGREEGAATELDRVKGHLTMAESTGAVVMAHANILEGKNLSEQSVVAGYMSEGLKARDIDAAADDSPDGDLDNADDQDIDAAEANLLAGVMDRSRKTGAAINPKQEA